MPCFTWKLLELSSNSASLSIWLGYKQAQMVNWKLLQNTLLSQYVENQKVQGHFYCQLQYLLVR